MRAACSRPRSTLGRWARRCRHVDRDRSRHRRRPHSCQGAQRQKCHISNRLLHRWRRLVARVVDARRTVRRVALSDSRQCYSLWHWQGRDRIARFYIFRPVRRALSRHLAPRRFSPRHRGRAALHHKASTHRRQSPTFRTPRCRLCSATIPPASTTIANSLATSMSSDSTAML
jgi:hypothetical protein